jgi:hypothetical protein
MAYSVTRSNRTGVALPRRPRRRAGGAGRETAAAARRRARGARRARFGVERRRRRAPAPLRARRARPASPGILATVGESHGTLSMSIERAAREARRGDGVEGSDAWRGDGVEQPHTRAGEGDIRGTGECHTQRRSKTKGNNAGRHGRPGLPRAGARREGERPPRPLGGVVRRRREL